MKIISLWQPWASLMAHGHKQIETRSWPTSYRGPLLIHAAKRWTAEEADYHRVFQRTLCVEFDVPLGCIVGLVHLAAVDRTEDMVDYLDEPELSFGNYSTGRWAWTTNLTPVLIDPPIPLRGQQGLWDAPPEIVREIAREIAE